MLLELEGIRRVYPEFALTAEFGVEEGEFFTILGPSGSGKTTLLRLIAGFERPEAGRIRLAGEDVTALPAHKRRLSMVFQDYALFPHLSVEENVAYGLKVRGIPLAERRRRAMELLELVGLAGFGRRDPNTLSGGEKQRVAVARALAPAPLAVLFDEPFSALDQNLRQNLRREIKELQRRTGFTAVFVTHSREEAFALADRMLIMGTGRVEQIGRPEELYRRPVSAYVADFLGEMNRLPARVDPGAGRISLGGASLALPHDIQWPAGEGYLLLRPEDASLCAEPRPDALPVTVIARQFGGPTVRFLVEGDGWTASVLHLSNASPAVGPGEAAWLQPALRRGSFMAAGRNAEGISGDCRELPHRSPVG